MKKRIHYCNSILWAANLITNASLPAGCLIHATMQKVTCTVYLKVDAGVACTIRLSTTMGNGI